MAEKLPVFPAIDKALQAGWQLHVSGGEESKLIVIRVFKPGQSFAWATFYAMHFIDALTHAGDTLREVI